jgi:hypothetical protein
VLAMPLIMYGSEFLAMNRTVERITETVEIQFLRYVSGYTLKVQRSNMNI